MINDRANHYAVEVDPSAPNNTHAFALELVGANKRVLELGCAGGHVTRALVQRACTVVGCELDPEAAALAREVAERVHVVDLSDPDQLRDAVGDDRFDVVLAGDVLEHLPDPLPLLRACRHLLAGGGYLVISLPNIAHADVKLALLAGRFPYGDQGLLDRTHLRFFTRAAVAELLADAGFLMTEVRRVTRPVFETELGVEREGVSDEVLDAVLADPDALTYQFVVKAVLDDADAEVAGLAGRVVALEDQLAEAEARASRAGEGMVPAAAITELQGAIAHLEGVVAQLGSERDAAAADAAAARAELDSVRRTVSYRLTAPLRRLRGALR